MKYTEYLRCNKCGKLAPLNLQTDGWKKKFKKYLELKYDLGIDNKIPDIDKYTVFNSDIFCWGGGEDTYFFVRLESEK